MSTRSTIVLSLVGLGAFIALCAAGGSFVVVNPGERGVVVRYGSISDTVMTEGLNWKTPFIDTVDIMNVQIQKFEAPSADASSKDMQSVKTGVTVNYRLNPAGVVAIRRELGVDDAEAHQVTVIAPQLKESIKAVTARYKADELLVNRSKVRAEMQALLQEKLDNVLPNAFVIVEFAITDFNFSDTFNAAIEAKVEAEQSALRVQNQVAQAESEALKKVAESRGKAQSMRLEAQAEADAIRIRAQAFKENPEVLQLDFVRRWDGKLPLVIGGKPNGFMLGIDGIAGGGK
jgi:regulator of protease activity HflC (stomatin/prohibitin superfamily)